MGASIALGDSKKNARLALFVATNVVSNLGSWMTALAIYTLVTFNGHGTAQQNAGILIASLLPTLIATPFVPAALRFVTPKTLMAGSLILQGGCVLALIFVHSLATIYLIITVQAVFGAFYTPSQFVLLPNLVSSAELARANATVTQWNSATKIFAPVLAGLAVVLVGPIRVLWIDIVADIIAACLITQLPAARLPEKIGTLRSLSTRVLASIVRKDHSILLASLALVTSLPVALEVILPTYIRDVLHSNASYFSTLLAAFSIGSLLMATGLRRVGGPASTSRVAVGCGIFACYPLIMLSTSAVSDLRIRAGAIALAAFLAGLGTSLTATTANALLQGGSAGEARAIVGSAASFVIMAGQITVIILAMLFGNSPRYFMAFFATSLAVLIGVSGFELMKRSLEAPAR